MQFAYAIGVAKPVGVHVNTFGTGKISDEKLEAYILENFDMRPKALIDELNLLRPQYKATAAYGHFGRREFAWEKTERAARIADDLLGGKARREPSTAKIALAALQSSSPPRRARAPVGVSSARAARPLRLPR